MDPELLSIKQLFLTALGLVVHFYDYLGEFDVSQGEGGASVI